MGFSLRLQRFCCCCTLRTGTLVIGTLGWRFCCCCSLRTGTLIIGTLGWLNTLSQIFITPGSMHLNNNELGHSEQKAVTDNALIARIGACLISLLVSVLLIVGVYKKNNKFMLPWLVLQCLGLIIISIACFICFGAIFFVPSEHTAILISITCALILMGSVAWYCWICVWSHYMELSDSEGNNSPNIQYAPTHSSPPPYSKADAPLV